MSILSVRVGFPALTLVEYRQVMAALDFPDKWPAGLVAHGAYEVDGQLLATSVWESREHWETFRHEQLQPAMSSALGDDADPPSEIVRELHIFYSRDHAEP